MTEEQQRQAYELTLRKAALDGWYLAGEIEWIDGKPHMPESIIGKGDLLWLQVCQFHEGRPTWSWAISSDHPDNGNKRIDTRNHWSVMNILQNIANDIYIAKWGVRLAGMKEWVLKEGHVQPTDNSDK